MSSNSPILASCALMVWEKKAYVFLGDHFLLRWPLHTNDQRSLGDVLLNYGTSFFIVSLVDCSAIRGLHQHLVAGISDLLDVPGAQGARASPTH
uniref:Uncharacterized protein n=1 Tax=Anguilla anguilla TaxID=7936 RepID=A0A0E9VA63_ANGAN